MNLLKKLPLLSLLAFSVSFTAFGDMSCSNLTVHISKVDGPLFTSATPNNPASMFIVGPLSGTDFIQCGSNYYNRAGVMVRLLVYDDASSQVVSRCGNVANSVATINKITSVIAPHVAPRPAFFAISDEGPDARRGTSLTYSDKEGFFITMHPIQAECYLNP